MIVCVNMNSDTIHTFEAKDFKTLHLFTGILAA